MRETIYQTPGGDRIRVIDTRTAACNLARMLDLFRHGESKPLFFGDAGEPECVVISWREWARLDALDADDDQGFDHLYEITRQRIADWQSKFSVPLEDFAQEIGWDLDGRCGDGDNSD